MSRRCQFTGKSTSAGRKISRRGLAKCKGGVGKKTTGITKRKFKPNIQKVRINTGGGVRRVKVCAKFLQRNMLELKPVKQAKA